MKNVIRFVVVRKNPGKGGHNPINIHLFNLQYPLSFLKKLHTPPKFNITPPPPKHDFSWKMIRLPFGKTMFPEQDSAYVHPISWLTEPENGFIEPKYLAFRFGDWIHPGPSSSDVSGENRIPRVSSYVNLLSQWLTF